MYARGFFSRPAFAFLGLMLSPLVAPHAAATCTVTCSATVPATGAVSTPISFQSTGAPCACANAASYLWDFGDGGTSTEQNPSHSYSSTGAKNWQLTVSADGVTCTKSGTIGIGGVVPLAGTYSGSTSAGQTFSLVVNGSNQITSWTIGYSNVCSSTGSVTVNTTCTINNGSFSCGSASCIPFSTQTSISGTFSDQTTVAGNATIKVQPGLSTCCTSTPTFSGTRSPSKLYASAMADQTSGTAPLNVNFTGGGSGGTMPYTFNWDFGDCSSPSSSQNPSHSYAAGSWNAVLTVTDGNNSTATAVVGITSQSAAPTHFVVSAPAQTTPGAAFSVTVTAKDAGENTATSYAGTIHFTSSDGGASLPGDYTFTGGDAGTHTFTNGVTLNSVGSQSITATENSVTGSANVTVGYSTSSSVTSSPNPSAQGQNVTFTANVTSSGGTVNGGTVTFKSGNTSIGTGGVTNGVATFSTTGLSGGPHSMTAEYGGSGNFFASTSSIYMHYVLLSAPSGVTATASTTTSVAVSWNALSGAAEYDIQRSSDNVNFSTVGTTSGTTFNNTVNVAAGTTYFYKVRGRDAGSNYGAFSGSDPATTVIFDDDPLVTGTTTVNAAHIAQLRTAVNAMRTAAGLGAGTYTDPTLTAQSTVIKTNHIADLRTALNAARTQLGLGALTFTDPTLTAQSTQVKGVHVTELRNGVK